MEDPKWLRLITIGLVLAALAVGYFLFSGRLAPDRSAETQATPAPTILGQNAQVSPSPTAVPAASPSPSPTTAFDRIASRTQNGAREMQTLPRTGFPQGLAVVFSISALIAGWGLRRYPH